MILSKSDTVVIAKYGNKKEIKNDHQHNVPSTHVPE